MHQQDIPEGPCLPPSQGNDRDWSPQAQDNRDQGAVLILVLDAYPTHLRMSELVLEVTAGSGDFPARDRVERAVRDLVAAGLLFRCEALILPTRSAIRFNEILGEEGDD
jgi:hypothetical protein